MLQVASVSMIDDPVLDLVLAGGGCILGLWLISGLLSAVFSLRLTEEALEIRLVHRFTIRRYWLADFASVSPLTWRKFLSLGMWGMAWRTRWRGAVILQRWNGTWVLVTPKYPKEFTTEAERLLYLAHERQARVVQVSAHPSDVSYSLETPLPNTGFQRTEPPSHSALLRPPA